MYLRLNIFCNRNMMDGIREIEARLDNMSIMALKMSHAIGIDVPLLL